MKKKFTTQDMVIVGLMAAVVYAATIVRVEIPTPMGKTMLHFATVACLLSGLLFGPVRGGLAGGIGSFFFDIFNGIQFNPFGIVNIAVGVTHCHYFSAQCLRFFASVNSHIARSRDYNRLA